MDSQRPLVIPIALRSRYLAASCTALELLLVLSSTTAILALQDPYLELGALSLLILSSIPCLYLARSWSSILGSSYRVRDGQLIFALSDGWHPMDLRQIDALTVSQNALDRLFRVGRVDIQLKGGEGQLSLHGVSHPRAVIQDIQLRMDSKEASL